MGVKYGHLCPAHITQGGSTVSCSMHSTAISFCHWFPKSLNSSHCSAWENVTAITGFELPELFAAFKSRSSSRRWKCNFCGFQGRLCPSANSQTPLAIPLQLTNPPRFGVAKARAARPHAAFQNSLGHLSNKNMTVSSNTPKFHICFSTPY